MSLITLPLSTADFSKGRSTGVRKHLLISNDFTRRKSHFAQLYLPQGQSKECFSFLLDFEPLYTGLNYRSVTYNLDMRPSGFACLFFKGTVILSNNL